MSVNSVIYPKKLRPGSHIRVVSPARSLSIISQQTRNIANERFGRHSFKISYAAHAEEANMFVSASVQSRVDDLHDAFSDPSVDAILTTIGGYNCNELLNSLDYNLIRKNPKILCGYSDITALAQAIHVKTGLVTYSGTHYSSWGMRKGFDYSEEYFLKCCAGDEPFRIEPSLSWSDEAWFMDQENRNFIPNDGHWIINRGAGAVTGKILGGNLGLLNILQGTPYFPDLKDSILFLEHCAEEHEFLFNRGIQSLIQQNGFTGVKGIVIGRFQQSNRVTKDMLTEMIRTKPALENIPVIANVDFGHTTPTITFPIGGMARIGFDGDGKAQIDLQKF
jgi:muramoyltetrapeptide carboxypeptidase